MPFAGKWIQLEMIILRKLSDPQKDKDMFALICHSYKFIQRHRIICTDNRKVGANLSRRHRGPKAMGSGGPLVPVEYDQRTYLHRHGPCNPV